MEKKVVALGPKDRKSFIVTLPIDWVKQQKLDQTRKADLEIVENAIVIRPLARQRERVLLDAEQLPNSVRRAILINYKKGVDEIKVMNTDPKIINRINEAIEGNCIGYEVIDQGKDYCIIKDIAKESSEDFQAMVRRCFLIVLQMAEENDPEQIMNLDKSLNKLTAYCQRLLVKQGYSEFQNINNYLKLCDELEKVGDEYKRALVEKENISKKVTQLFKATYDLFYKFAPRGFDTLNMEAKSFSLSSKKHFERSLMRRIVTIVGVVYALRA